MSSKGIDIKNICPINSNSDAGPCHDDGRIQAKRGDLEATEYGYVTHRSFENKIDKLTYGRKSLQIEDGKKGDTLISFTRRYPDLKEVTTYYYREGENDEENIHTPLVLRVNGGEAYHLYLNTGGDHTKWKHVSLRGLDRIPSGNTTTPELTSRLKSQTCRLHRLHKIDVKNNQETFITCSVCKKAKIRLNDKPERPVDCYKKFCHTPSDDDGDGKITYPITYGNELSKYKDGKTWKIISVTKSEYANVSVYYWEGDKKLDNPLLMELKPTNEGKSIWYENLGESAGKHDKWRKLGEQEAINLSSPGNLKEKLDFLSCIFNGTVRIKLGLAPNCHNSPDFRHKNRLRTYVDGSSHRHLSLSIYEYTPRIESGSDPFHVSEFYLEGHKQIFSGSPSFFKDVKKVTGYASSCDSARSFLLCIETGFNKKWYRRIQTNTWENCDNVDGKLEGIFKSAQSTLGIIPCPLPKSLPPDGLKLVITTQPPNDKLTTIYYDYGSGNTPILVAKDHVGLPKGFFRVIHTASTVTGYFMLSRNLGRGGTIPSTRRSEQSINNVKHVEVYFGTSNPNLPILLGIATNTRSVNETKYYSYSSTTGRADQGKWLQREYFGLKSTSLTDMLDDQNGYRNMALPIELKDPVHFEQFCSKIENTGTIPYLKKKSYISSSKPPPELPQEARKNYEVEGYQVNDSAQISRVTFGGEDTNIIPPKDKVSELRIYRWKNGKDSDKVPLLLEFKPTNGKPSTWFENLDKESLHWMNVKDEDAMKFYTGSPLQGNYTEAVTKKLDEVSCRLHHTVKIDVFIKDNRKLYCHRKCTYKRIKVEQETSMFPKYIGYEHTSDIKGENFTITALTNKDNVQNTNLPYPLENVKTVTVYFSTCDQTTPLMIYIHHGVTDDEINGQSIWLKNENKEGKWTDVSDKIRVDTAAIEETLNSVTNTLGLCPRIQGSTGAVTRSEGEPYEELEREGLDEAEDVEEEEEEEEGAQVPESPMEESSEEQDPDGTPEPTLTATSAATQSPLGSLQPNAVSRTADTDGGPGNSDIKNISIITSSVLGASGSITGFAYWIYKRFAGEPWVRQI
ncbi:hypothetical protein BEWA_016070 [Theileria equi strain WA]|uniref:Uncharacterized protein n=1 Tax=Theileria equi strain WA TaxID=1537102 RepID=L1LCH9_THEEQ|nr:hypothetical protein BEWA_016070 [Theileria equi strain WA]EKX73046.1 hypothetical protein BEWA_016070 [Theileria equi strain WA]|eukprot:XP_004832498.1 hypothetical protein BEWA_016070 [Theileria equi strain WA]